MISIVLLLGLALAACAPNVPTPTAAARVSSAAATAVVSVPTARPAGPAATTAPALPTAPAARPSAPAQGAPPASSTVAAPPSIVSQGTPPSIVSQGTPPSIGPGGLPTLAAGAAPTRGAGAPASSAAGPGSPASPVAVDGVVVLTRADGATREVTVEIAATDARRERGLMERTTMPETHGMLFVFPTDITTPFWMKDTPLPLSIAFIAADGRIVDIQDMQPRSTDLHSSARPYRYALEVNQGFFARAGIKVGDRASLPSRV